jgi:hypothetical protein
VSLDAIGNAWTLLSSQIGTWIAAGLVAFVITLIVTLPFVLIVGGKIRDVMAAGAIPGAGGLTPGTGFPPAGGFPSGGGLQPGGLQQGNPFGGATPPGMGAGAFGLIFQMIGQFIVLGLLFALILWVVQTYLSGGFYRMALKQSRGDAISLGDLFSAHDVLLPLLGATFILFLINTISGCILGAVLGVLFRGSAVGMLIIRLCSIALSMFIGGIFMFARPLIVDKKAGAIEALGMSWNALISNWLMAAVFFFINGILGVIGICIFGVGILVTYPFLILSPTVLYRQFFPDVVAEGAQYGAYPQPPIPDPSVRYQ